MKTEMKLAVTNPELHKEQLARGKRYITNEDLTKLEACFDLKMLSPFERAFLEDFRTRFEKWGMRMTIFSKQEKILNDLFSRFR